MSNQEIRTGPNHPDYPHEKQRIPREFWNEAEKACPTCSFPGRETVGLVCQTCGTDYSRPAPVSQRSKLLWVGVDLDGTLAAPLWTPSNPTSEIGDPIWENVAKLKALVAQGYKPIIHTSRPWTDYEAIENYLVHYGIPFKEIQCGKPLYAAYIDDRAIDAADEDWTPRVN